jgi:hypothetical protein
MAVVDTNWYTIKTHPAKTNEVPKDEVITGKATAMAVPLIADSNNDRLTVTKTRYLDT